VRRIHACVRIYWPANRPGRTSRSAYAIVGSAAFLLVVVERSKKCLDFAATVHIVHLVACCIYAGWPSHWESVDLLVN
jgi:hypothetical protein